MADQDNLKILNIYKCLKIQKKGKGKPHLPKIK